MIAAVQADSMEDPYVLCSGGKIILTQSGGQHFGETIAKKCYDTSEVCKTCVTQGPQAVLQYNGSHKEHRESVAARCFKFEAVASSGGNCGSWKKKEANPADVKGGDSHAKDTQGGTGSHSGSGVVAIGENSYMYPAAPVLADWQKTTNDQMGAYKKDYAEMVQKKDKDGSFTKEALEYERNKAQE